MIFVKTPHEKVIPHSTCLLGVALGRHLFHHAFHMVIIETKNGNHGDRERLIHATVNHDR
jgi:hypothetical protein